jgi:uncharacterized protein YggL (DUF469 family)
MKKRIRKKKRVGEFQELGFEVSASLRAGTSDVELEAFVGRLLDFVETRELAFGGGAGFEGRLSGFVTRGARGSATDDDRQALARFLVGDGVIAEHEIGRLEDAWH